MVWRVQNFFIRRTSYPLMSLKQVRLFINFLQILKNHQMPENSKVFVLNNQITINIKRQNPNHYYDINSIEIGKGAFGSVFKGKIRGNDDVWRAIKKIDRKAVPNDEMLVNQIEIMVALDHPSIIKLYEIFEWKNSVYLVTDLCEGGQLFDKLQEVGAFSEETARIIFKQMLEAVSYLHHNKIAHRDLKPENFLFVSKGSLNLKLIDFGLAYCWEQDMKKELRKNEQRKLVGTSYYLSPEVAQFRYDQRCDIWSAGVILYMLISGSAPFGGETDKQIIRNVKRLEYSMEISEFQGVSNELKDLIKKILVPADERITIQEISNHPWMKINLPPCPLAIGHHKMVAFAKYSKKFNANFVDFECSQKQFQKLAEVLTKNKNGTIPIEQFKMALEYLNKDTDLDQVKRMIGSIDIDEHGGINQTEFLAYIMEKCQVFNQKSMTIGIEKQHLDEFKTSVHA